MEPPEFTGPAQVALAPDEWALVAVLEGLGRAVRPRAVRAAEVVVQLDDASPAETVHDETQGGV